MKFIFRIIIIASIAYLIELILPWWFVAVFTFALAMLWKASSTNAFLSGLLGIGLLWFGAGLYFNISTESLLPERVAGLFQLGSPFVLAALTGLIGAVVGGLSSLCGSYLRKLLDHREIRSRY